MTVTMIRDDLSYTQRPIHGNLNEQVHISGSKWLDAHFEESGTCFRPIKQSTMANLVEEGLGFLNKPSGTV